MQNMNHIELPKEVPAEDGLKQMLDLQKKINSEIYPIVLKNLRITSVVTPKDELILKYKEELTKEYLLAIIRECAETLDMINSKPWKNTTFVADVREVKFEFIDIQKFLNSIYDIWKMDREEILKFYIAKHQEVKRRVDSGY